MQVTTRVAIYLGHEAVHSIHGYQNQSTESTANWHPERNSAPIIGKECRPLREHRSSARTYVI